jgi:ribonuclease D
VDTPAGVAGAAGRLGAAAAIAVDTEADSFYHYLHKCCLIQVSDGSVVYLVDPLARVPLDPLARVLSSERIVKVLHAAEQDVLYLRRDLGITLRPLFDTMIAAQLLGKPGIGLAALLESYFGVRLDKSSQRDDWSRRPLSDRQRAYAAEDVRHLIGLAERLRSELQAVGRLEWAQEEFDLVAGRAWEPRPFDPESFWGIKGSRELEPRQAGALRALHVMREERAMRADVPPFRIASDETLQALARRLPRRPEDLQGIKGVTPLVRRRLGADILEAVARALAVPESALPAPPRGAAGRRRTAAARARLDRLREWRKQRAAELGLDPGVLFPMTTLEALAAGGPPVLEKPEEVPGLRRWRLRILLADAGPLLG